MWNVDFGKKPIHSNETLGSAATPTRTQQASAVTFSEEVFLLALVHVRDLMLRLFGRSVAKYTASS
jgi:hypothetical protein